jgi:uncharacterized protein involved in outer membrane biogenesis
MKLFLKIFAYTLGGIAALVGAGIATLFLIDWNDLRGFVNSEISSTSGRKVVINGKFDVQLGSWPTIIADDVSFANADWGSQPQMAHIDHLQVRFRLLSVLFGPLDIDTLRVNGFTLLLEQQGERANWRFGTTGPTTAAVKAATPKTRSQFPTIRHLEITDWKLTYKSPKLEQPVRTEFKEISLQTPDAHSPVKAHVQGTYKKRPMALDGTLGPFGELQSRSKLYPVKLKGKIGALAMTVDAGVNQPLDFQGIDGKFELKGNSLSELYDVVGLPLPKTDPFQFDGRLRKQGEEWVLDNFRGRLGNSTLSGTFRTKTGTQRPKIVADLTSEVLHFEDFKGFWASKKSPPTKKGGPVFSREPISLPKLNRMDAEVRFRGKAIDSGTLKLRNIGLDLKLDNGFLRLQPIDFYLQQGHIVVDAGLNTRQPIPQMTAGIQVDRLDLNAFLKLFGMDTDSAGTLRGNVTVKMHGRSPHDLAASAAGGGMIVMGGGRISDIILQAAALDLQQALGDLIHNKQVPVNCVVMPMEIKAGRIKADPWLFDTSNNLLALKGVIDLGAEKVQMTLEVHPKDFSLFNTLSSIRITGDLAKRTANVNKLALAGKLVLKTLAAPLMTFLSKPIQERSQEMSPCKSVFDQIRAAGGIAAAAGTPGGAREAVHSAAKEAGAAQPSKKPEAGNGTAPKPNAAEAAPQRDKITRIQEALRKAKIGVKVDGVLGPQTQAALRRFQASHGLKQTGIPDRATVLALGLTADNAVQPSGQPAQPAQRGG